MNILLVLIPISLVLLGVAIAAFAGADRGGHFEVLASAALDILRDDAAPDPPPGDEPHAD
jgi:cbb3-type cytochrome oxidase maturation protein